MASLKNSQDRTQNEIEREIRRLNRSIARDFRAAYAEIERRIDELYARMDTPSLINANKFDRLNKIKRLIADKFNELTGKHITESGALSRSAFRQASLDLRDAINGVVDIDLAFDTVPIETVRASVNSEISGLDYIQTFRKNRNLNTTRTQAAITRGLARGESVQKVAKSVQDAFNRGFTDAERVVRTETLRNLSEGQLFTEQKAIDAGIEFVKVWDTNMDGRERQSHAEMNSRQANSEGYFPTPVGLIQGPRLSGVASFDINCRCQAVLEVQD